MRDVQREERNETGSDVAVDQKAVKVATRNCACVHEPIRTVRASNVRSNSRSCRHAIMGTSGWFRSSQTTCSVVVTQRSESVRICDASTEVMTCLLTWGTQYRVTGLSRDCMTMRQNSIQGLIMTTRTDLPIEYLHHFVSSNQNFALRDPSNFPTAIL
jgi:hypothetical protein